VDVFGFPETIVSFPELLAMMIMAASPMERPMKSMDASAIMSFRLQGPYPCRDCFNCCYLKARPVIVEHFFSQFPEIPIMICEL
jgi:hypothetical protein